MKPATFSDRTLRLPMFLALDRGRLATIPEIAPACRLAAILLPAFDALFAAPGECPLADLVRASRSVKALLVRCGPRLPGSPIACLPAGRGRANGLAR